MSDGIHMHNVTPMKNLKVVCIACKDKFLTSEEDIKDICENCLCAKDKGIYISTERDGSRHVIVGGINLIDFECRLSALESKLDKIMSMMNE